MIKKLILLLALSLLLFGGTVSAQDDVLTVDASASLGTISPYVYGANFGLYFVVAPGMMEQAQALGLGYTRLGGGVIDQQDLRTSIVDMFVMQSQMLGAEPSITVRLMDGTPEAAAEMVRYVNIEKGYNVRYWSIGNEPNLFETLFNHPYTTEDLNREWRAIAEAMLAVDPDIMLVGPDITQYVVLNAEPDNMQYLENPRGGFPVDRNGKDWMFEFLKANGDLVDVVSIHRYPYPGAGTGRSSGATVEGLRELSREWDVSIPNLRQVIRDAAGRDIPIAVTELNSNSNNSIGSEASLESLYNAVWLADVLGRLIRHGVEYVAVWDLQGDTGRGWSLMDRYEARPTYYTYLLYSQFGTELLQADSPDANVSIYAAKREDGALTLMVVNLGDDEATKMLKLTGFSASVPAEVFRLDAEHNAAQIESVSLADGGSLTVPGRSVTLYVVPPAP